MTAGIARSSCTTGRTSAIAFRTRRLIRSATAAERNGDFSDLLNSTGQRVTIYDPLSTVATTVNGVTTYSRTPFAGNIIPQNRISRVSRNMLAYLPLPNVIGNGFGQNNFSDPSNTRSDKYDIHSFRFDHAFNEQNKFFADVLRSNRHEVNDNAGFVGAASPLYLHWRTNTGVIADLTSILSPTTVLDSPRILQSPRFCYRATCSRF